MSAITLFLFEAYTLVAEVDDELSEDDGGIEPAGAGIVVGVCDGAVASEAAYLDKAVLFLVVDHFAGFAAKGEVVLNLMDGAGGVGAFALGEGEGIGMAGVEVTALLATVDREAHVITAIVLLQGHVRRVCLGAGIEEVYGFAGVSDNVALEQLSTEEQAGACDRDGIIDTEHAAHPQRLREGERQPQAAVEDARSAVGKGGGVQVVHILGDAAFGSQRLQEADGDDVEGRTRVEEDIAPQNIGVAELRGVGQTVERGQLIYVSRFHGSERFVVDIRAQKSRPILQICKIILIYAHVCASGNKM